VPPLIVVALLLVVWELICRRAGSSLPPPSKVFKDTKELILRSVLRPWRHRQGAVLASLCQPAARRLRLFAGGDRRDRARHAGRPVVWAMRGLDPLFQVLRTIPPLAWLPLSLAAFRDGQPSAIFVIFITSVWPIIINTAVGIRNIPQDYRNVAAVVQLNPLEFFAKIMIPAAAPYIFTGLRIGIACRGSRSSPPRC